MGKRVKLFDDEILARRVFTKSENAKKSSFNYKKNKQIISKNKPIINKNFSKEVLVKITGNSKNFQAFKAHIKYITRNDELEIYEDENITYKGKEETKEFLKDFNSNFINKIPNKNENLKEKREAYHIVFSMREHSKVPKEKILKATMKTVKKMFPNNESAFVYHGDTNNPHIHTVLKVKNDKGKRLDIRKNDLANLRKNFAKELNNLGIEAEATIKRNYEKREAKKHYYEVVEFGKAKYKFSKEENAKNSYYVKYKTKNGNAEIWSDDLERVIKENNVKIGEFVKFKIIDKKPINLDIYINKNGRKIKVTKQVYKSVWDCSVMGREKELNILDKNKIYKPKYNIENIESSLSKFNKFKKDKKSNIIEKSLENKEKTPSKFSKFKSKLAKKKDEVER